MAVFKRRLDGNEPAKYRNDGIGNMYHIGLVCGVNPLRIIHATTPVAKADAVLGQWSHYGLLSAVGYDSTAEDTQTPDDAAPYPLAMVIANSGKVVRMRAEPSTSCRTWWNVPIGSIVQVIESKPPGWMQIEYNGRRAFMMDAYLLSAELQPADVPEPEPDAPPVVLPEPPPDLEQYGKVIAQRGDTVKMRVVPSQTCATWWNVPVGATVRIISSTLRDWHKISYNGRTGYMLREFIEPQ